MSTAGSDLGKKRSALAFSEVVDQVVVDQAKRQKVNKTGSKAKQDSWTQEDKEHTRKLEGTLLVHGFVLGTIMHRSDVMRGGIVPGDWLEKLGWDRNSKENRVPDSVWRTLVADRTTEGSNPEPWYPRACLHCLKDTRITNARGDLDTHKVQKVAGSDLTAAYLLGLKPSFGAAASSKLNVAYTPKVPLYTD